MRLFGLIIVSALSLSAQVGFTDPNYVIPGENPYTTPADQQRGEKIFLGQCARCHGAKGEGGLGAVLAEPRLRHAPDDETLFKVIREGIKGTDMPGVGNLTYREIWQLAAYVRSLGRVSPESVAGNPEHGREIYDAKGKCGQCHVLAGKGVSVGPELTDIGTRRNVAYLRTALLDPEANFPDGFLQVSVTTKDGRRLTGVRLSEDTFTLQMTDLNGRTYSFNKDELKEIRKDPGKSPMPSYKALLSSAELDDLVAWLAAQRGEQ